MAARERALANVLLRRGLLTPGALARVQSARGAQQTLFDALVSQQVATQDTLRSLGHELSTVVWSCDPCRRTFGWDDLARFDLLACPACGQGLKQRQDLSGTTTEGSTPTVRARSSGLGGAEFSGQSIGPYELVRELGRGSNGVVYLGRRPGIERYLAVKILRDADQADQETVARFQLEAAVASKLQHPGIAAVHDVGEDRGHKYYAMDYVKGPTLKERLRNGALDEREAAVLVGRLAKALAHAHDAGVVHRDVKPANIILEEGSGKPRIMDFGLARDRSLLRSMTQSGDVIGTPFYMAPEQFRGEKHLDHRVDIYALGAIFYEALCGQRPYTATSALELAEKVIRGDPPPPAQVEPSVSPAFEAICLRAMAVDANDRFPTAGALRDALEQALRKDQAAPSSPSPPTSGTPARAIAVAVLVLGVISAGALLWVSRSSPPAPVGATSSPGEAPEAELIAEARALLRQRVLEDAPAPYPDVRALFERAVRRLEGDPAQAEARLELAEYVLHRGQHEQAQGLLGALALSGPSAARADLLRGRAHEEAGQLLAAREAWSAATARDVPGWSAAAAAALARDSGDPAGAKAAAAADDEHAAVLLERARAQLCGGPSEQDQAQLALDRLVQRTPGDPAVVLALADLRLRQGKLDLAEHSLARAFALTTPYPHLPALRLNARLNLAREAFREAIADCDQALMIAPADTWALTIRGLARLQLDDPEGARADLERAGLADEARQARLLALVDDRYEAQARALFEPAPEPQEDLAPEAPAANPFMGGGGTTPSAAEELLKSMFSGGSAADRPPWGKRTPALSQALDTWAAPFEGDARDALRQALERAATVDTWANVRVPLWRAAKQAPGSEAVALAQLTLCVGQRAIADGQEVLERVDAAGWDDPWFDVLRGDLAWRGCDPDAAVKALRPLASRDDAAGHAASALLAFIGGDLATASLRADRATKANPRCPIMQVLAAICRCMLERCTCEQTLSEVGLIDHRLVIGHYYGSLAYDLGVHLEAGQVMMSSEMRPLAQGGAGVDDDYLALFTVDVAYLVLDRLELDLGRAPNPLVKMAVGTAASQVSLYRDSGYRRLFEARQVTRQRSADQALRAWERSAELSPALGIPPGDRARIEARFPGDERFDALVAGD